MVSLYTAEKARCYLASLAKEYGTQEIKQFLQEIDIPDEVIEQFEDNEVTGPDLLEVLEVSSQGLEDIGVSSELHRLKILILFKRKLRGDEPDVSPLEVASFLRRHKMFQKYEKAFVDNGIDGELLLNASAGVLEELGVGNRFHQSQLKTKFTANFPPK